MSTSPRTYRVVCFDGARNQVSADWLTANSDEHAIAETQASSFGSKCELWHGRRLVAQIEAERRLA